MLVPALPPEGVYVTEHFDDPALPANVQVVELKLPLLLLVKETLPVGVTAVPDAVSFTLAVHVEEEPICKLDGEHAALVEVLRRPFPEPLQRSVPSEREVNPPPTKTWSASHSLFCTLPATPHEVPYEVPVATGCQTPFRSTFMAV